MPHEDNDDNLTVSDVKGAVKSSMTLHEEWDLRDKVIDLSGKADARLGFSVMIGISTICFLIVSISQSGQVINLRKEAIERGFAEYTVDSSGHTEWHWKEQPERAK